MEPSDHLLCKRRKEDSGPPKCDSTFQGATCDDLCHERKVEPRKGNATKVEKRRLSNRLSARRWRYRKRRKFSDLHHQIMELQRDQAQLEKDNKKLRKELDDELRLARAESASFALSAEREQQRNFHGVSRFMKRNFVKQNIPFSHPMGVASIYPHFPQIPGSDSMFPAGHIETSLAGKNLLVIPWMPTHIAHARQHPSVVGHVGQMRNISPADLEIMLRTAMSTSF